MKDMDLINRKFKEYERKIQRLQQLKAEFESANTDGFESEATAINSKLLDPTKVDEIEADIILLKSKIKERDRKEQKRKEALKAINILNVKLKEAEKLGITVNKSAEFASSAFDKEDYDNAINSANEGEEELEDRIKLYRDALNQINKSKSEIDIISRAGHSVEKSNDLTEKAESELKAGNHASAIKIAKEAEEEAVRVKKDYDASKEASTLIFSVASDIAKIRSSGVKISKSEESIGRAESELSKNNFGKAKKWAKEAKEIAYQRKESYEKAFESIASAIAATDDTKSRKIDVSSAEKRLNRAKSSFDEGKYEGAFEFSKQAEAEALRLKKMDEAYKETSNLILSIESEIAAITHTGVKIHESSGNLIEQAKSELNKKCKQCFEKAKDLASRAKIIASERKDAYEKALNSISSVTDVINDTKSREIDISRAEELLSKARSLSDEGNYEKSFEVSKQAKEEALRSKKEHETYIETTDFISSIESEITEIENSGVKTLESDELLEHAKSELNNNTFERAKELANKAKNIALERKESSGNALKSFSSANKVITEIKSREIDISSAEELLNQARSSLDEGKYEEAFNLSKQAEVEALRLKKTHEAYIETSDFISSTESEITEIVNSGVKAPKSDELLEHAKSELNNNNFEKAKELANKARRIALERKAGYDLAFNSISSAEKVFNETKDKGVVISTDSLTKSKQAFDNGEYAEAIKLSEGLENFACARKIKCGKAQELIRSVESSIERAKEFGCNVLDVNDGLKNAEQLFEKGAYEEVIEASRLIEEQTKKIKQQSKPEIAISHSQTSFKPNKWARIDLTIKNGGTATAKEIHVDYPKERVEIEGLMAAEELKPNKEKALKITIRPIQEGEVPLTATITYRDLDNKEYKGEQSFWITVGENVGEKGKQITTIEIKRSFVELPNNDLKFGIRIINNTEYMIADVKTILDYPRTLFSLKDNVVKTLANISPNGKRTAKYILTPLGCIHNEKIDATISYNDHTGKKQTVQMRPKEVHCVCPFLKEKVIREGEFAELANTCERIEEGLSFSGIGVTELTVVIKESCAHRLYVISEHEVENAKIVYLAGESIGEKAYYLLTAVIHPYKNLTQVALRAYSDKPYGLRGFLNEIANSIRYLVGSVQSAKEIGIIESKQVINIIDSVVQRTSFGGSREGETSVNIEGSVVQRTEIGSLKRCPNCEKEVQSDEKFCKECGARLD